MGVIGKISSDWIYDYWDIWLLHICYLNVRVTIQLMTYVYHYFVPPLITNVLHSNYVSLDSSLTIYVKLMLKEKENRLVVFIMRTVAKKSE